MRRETVPTVLAVLGVGALALAGFATAQTTTAPQATPTANVPQSTAQNPPAKTTDYVTSVLVAGFGGFLGWILTKSLGWFLLRRRLLAYLKVVTDSNLRQYHDSKKWLAAVREKTLKEGHIVNLAADYTKDDLTSLTCVREQCLSSSPSMSWSS